jgi:hypothetical protein
MTKTRHYRKPVTNPQASDFGFNVDVNPLAEVIQGKATAKQMRVVEIAVDHLDDLQGHTSGGGEFDTDQRSPVEYAVNNLLYGGRPARADIRMFVGAIKQHLRQANVLTAEERRELSEVPTDTE